MAVFYNEVDITGWCWARSMSDNGKTLCYIGSNDCDARNYNFNVAIRNQPSTCVVVSPAGTRLTLSPEQEAFIHMRTFELVPQSTVGASVQQQFQRRWHEAGQKDGVRGYTLQFKNTKRKMWMLETIEQRMAFQYLSGEETILELGGCLGRVSCIAGSIVNAGGGKLVAVESRPDLVRCLAKNTARSGVSLQIIGKPLSQRRVAIKDGTWSSRTLEDNAPVPEGYHVIPTILLPELYAQTGINKFDTLVIDCEGAFYWILLEYPELIMGVKKVLIENDWQQVGHAAYVHSKLQEAGLRCIESVPLPKLTARTLAKLPPHRQECADCFWQCWVAY